jgi:hypothetical protein
MTKRCLQYHIFYIYFVHKLNIPQSFSSLISKQSLMELHTNLYSIQSPFPQENSSGLQAKIIHQFNSVSINQCIIYKIIDLSWKQSAI